MMKRLRYIISIFIFSFFIGCFVVNFGKSDNLRLATAQTNQSTSSVAGAHLSGLSKKMYDYLFLNLKQVADGDIDTCYFNIEKESFVDWEAKTGYTNTEIGKSTITLNDVSGLFLQQFDFSVVITALLHDMPYDLFWFDKTMGYRNSISGSTTGTNVEINSMIVSFQVSSEYKAENYDSTKPMVNQLKINSAKAALNNAKQIVESFDELSDYQKLIAYKNKICELVSYDNNAASDDYFGGYGNPWQVINVFDNEISTNVVCEGYAKAFQLLCNLTSFDSEYVKCYTVSGVMTGGTGAGGHMWNIVTMDDEISYLVDITNSEIGTVGQFDKLFLKGYNSGTLMNGFVYNLSSNIRFMYDDSEFDLWGTGGASVLNISSNNYDYQHPTIIVEQDDNIVYDGEMLTVGFVDDLNKDIKFSFEGELFDESSYNWQYSWFFDNDGLVGNACQTMPVNAGEYWIKVQAIHKQDDSHIAIHYEKILIKPKAVNIVKIEADGRQYNGTKLVHVTDATISGVLNGDLISISRDGLIAEILDADTGVYNIVNLSNIKLVGEDKDNYYIDSIKNNIPANNIEITKTNLVCQEIFDMVSVEGKTLADIEIMINAKGAQNESISGTMSWIDAEGNPLDLTTVINKYDEFRYKFIPNSENYSEYFGTVVLWGDPVVENNNVFDFLNNQKIVDMLPYICLGIIVLFLIICPKRKKEI